MNWIITRIYVLAQSFWSRSYFLTFLNNEFVSQIFLHGGHVHVLTQSHRDHHFLCKHRSLWIKGKWRVTNQQEAIEVFSLYCDTLFLSFMWVIFVDVEVNVVVDCYDDVVDGEKEVFVIDMWYCFWWCCSNAVAVDVWSDDLIIIDVMVIVMQ